MNTWLERLRRRYVELVWETDLGTLSRGRRALVWLARMGQRLGRDLEAEELGLRAMSLVYTTLLSLVPLLAVSFSMLKGLGVHTQLEPLLGHVLAPLGAKAPELVERVIGFVENMRVGVLGSVGLAFLIYTVISLVQKIEAAFNFIWRVDRPRRLARRFSDYMSVILIGPVLVFVALGITASVVNTAWVQQLAATEPMASVVPVLGRLVPYVLVSAAFAFVYVFVPNTRVSLRAALAGGLFAGVLWETLGWAFAAFIATSTRYAAIYSGFAILVLFMIWLYVSWLILLIGAQVSYYWQHPQALRPTIGELPLNSRNHERLGFTLMFLVAEHYIQGRHRWTADALAEHLNMPVGATNYVLRLLEQAGLILQVGSEPAAYVPARDVDTIRLQEVSDAVRGAGDVATFPPPVAELGQQLEQAIDQALADQTLKGWVQAQSSGPR